MEHQLGTVRNGELNNMFAAAAVGTEAVVAHQASLLAGMHSEVILADHQPLQQQLGCTVANHTVPLHLAQS